jgi:lysophospholipase L1-like esterase
VGTGVRADTVDPSDPDILYTGRWNHANPSEPWAQAKGASIQVNFEGTSLAITMTTSSSEYYRVVLDGDAAGSTKQTIASGVSTTLVSGLPDTVHHLEIVKERDPGRWTLQALDLDVGSGLAAAPARPTRRIVFYGDSNLAGYSLESERNLGGSILQGSYYTYAGITARRFDAEYHNISKSGATIQSLDSRYDRTDWGVPNPAWDFNQFPADVVVVNIGANDLGAPKNTIKSRYHALLDDLVVSHPSTPIVLYNAYGWDFDEPANYTHEVAAERADPNITSAVFPWVFEQFHGCETDHSGMAAYLVEHLSDVMGWVPSPSDVVVGYGVDGQVANGSFEGVAPFGGWGWRYFDDTGVSRVFGVDAFDGDYYLRLVDGAASQQTNPSSNGEEVVLNVWMRSPNVGDQVDVTIDFRDQQAGAAISAPMQTQTDTHALTTSWQQYTMSATAPTSPPDPVYASRVKFEARPGDTVEIDRVLLPEPRRHALLGAGLALLWLLADRRRVRKARARR